MKSREMDGDFGSFKHIGTNSQPIKLDKKQQKVN